MFVAILAMLVGVAWKVRDGEREAEAQLEARFRLRIEIAERFIAAYVEDILGRESRLASMQLSGRELSASDFDRLVRAFGFEAAVLVDRDGRLRMVYPARPEIIGTIVTAKYAHLREALASGAGVSSVVPSAAVGAPIVAFAARYESEGGQRVFSGAHDVRQTPLNAYIVSLAPMAGSTTDVVDLHGAIVASSRTLPRRQQSLAGVDPRLANAISVRSFGEYETDEGRRLFVVQRVSRAPWRLVAAVDRDALFGPLAGKYAWSHWLPFSAFSVAVFVVVFLVMRLLGHREELRLMNADLARLARVDRLTGLSNRLDLEEQLDRLLSAARRQEQPLSVLLLDIDHFKSVNDVHGHAAGDEVLRVLAHRMAEALRREDVIGRWGGEEFLALLPNTGSIDVSRVAERARAAVIAAPIELATRRALHVTISIGCATTNGDVGDPFLQRADEALYTAKRLGRNRVVSSSPPRATSLRASELNHG